jgi:hypothetical protein
MDPSSPPVLRTFHLLKTPDILCANDNRQLGNYQLVNRLDGKSRISTEKSASRKLS